MRPLPKPSKRENKRERKAIRRQLSELPGGAFGPHAEQRAGLIRRLAALFKTDKF